MVGVTLRWTSIPSRGSSNIPSHSMMQCKAKARARLGLVLTLGEGRGGGAPVARFRLCLPSLLTFKQQLAWSIYSVCYKNALKMVLRNFLPYAT